MWKFIKQFVLRPRQTGAILPSSPDLARAMLAPIDFKTAQHIVELGPGTGAFTHLILKKMKKDARLTAIEVNEQFYKQLKKIKDARLKLIHGDAQKLSIHAKSADYVISGLPLVSFTKEQRKKTLEEIKKVVRNKYVQFNYSPLAEKDLKEHFTFTKRTIYRNIPPATVYTCKPINKL